MFPNLNLTYDFQKKKNERINGFRHKISKVQDLPGFPYRFAWFLFLLRLKGGFPKKFKNPPHPTSAPQKAKKTHIKLSNLLDLQNDLQHLEQPLKVVQQSNLRLPARGRACEHVACRMVFSAEEHGTALTVLRKSGRSPLHGDQNQHFPELKVTL